MKAALIAAAALVLGAVSAQAEPDFQPTRVTIDNGEDDIGFGLGLTWTFGSKSAKSGLGIGLRAFSQRKQDSFAGSVGVDYRFADRSLRPNVGVAYLAKDGFYDLNYGYNFTGNTWGFGFGTGYAETAKNGTKLIEPDYK